MVPEDLMLLGQVKEIAVGAIILAAIACAARNSCGDPDLRGRAGRTSDSGGGTVDLWRGCREHQTMTSCPARAGIAVVRLPAPGGGPAAGSRRGEFAQILKMERRVTS